MAVIKSNVNGSSNVGLFGIAFQDKLLFGEKLRTKQKEEFERVLKLKILRVRIAGTDLPGVMLASNSKLLLVPDIVFDSELNVLDENDIPYKLIRTKVTCLGNTICCNDKGAILSTEFSEIEVERIHDALGVPCIQRDIAGLTTPGAVIVLNGKHAIVHKDASDQDVKTIKKILGVTSVEPATINLGGAHLRSGILHSKSGMIIGDQSGGPEIVNIDNSLGYNNL